MFFKIEGQTSKRSRRLTSKRSRRLTVELLEGRLCLASIIGSLALGNNSDGQIVVNPNTARVYIGGGYGANNQLEVIDVSNPFSPALVTSVAGGTGVAVDPVTNRYYTTDSFGGNLLVYDGSSNSLVASAHSGYIGGALDVDPTTDLVYLTDQGGNDNDPLWVLDGATNSFVAGPLGSGGINGNLAVNPATGLVYDSAGKPGGIYHTRVFGQSPGFSFLTDLSGSIIAVNPVTDRLYLATSSTSIEVLDGTTDAVLGTIAAGGGPSGAGRAAVNTNLNRLYFSATVNGAESVEVIDGMTNTIIENISLGPNIIAQIIAVNSSNNLVYVVGTDPNGNAILYVIQERRGQSNHNNDAGRHRGSRQRPKLTDSATLFGGSNPTGTITFTLYGPDSTVVDRETATVNGNGVYSTPSGYLPSVAGTYQWVVSYGGDINNGPAASTLGSEPEVAVSVDAWSGLGPDDNWTTAANWVGDVAPNPGDELVFPPVVNQTSVNDFAPGTAFESITISGTGYTLSGNFVTLQGAGLDGMGALHIDDNSNGSTTTITFPINLAGDTVIAVDQSEVDAITLLNGTISGPGGLIVQGGGDLRLGTANSYQGDTTIDAGSLWVQDSAGLGPSSATLTVMSGAELDVQGDITVPQAITLNGSDLSQIPTSGLTSVGQKQDIASLVAHGNNVLSGTITLNGAGYIGSAGGASAAIGMFTVTGSINGAGDLFLGTNTNKISGSVANTYAGRTIVFGTLLLDKTPGMNAVSGDLTVEPAEGGFGSGSTSEVRWLADDQLPAAASVSVQGGCTLDLNNNSDSIDQLDLLGSSTTYINVTTGTGTLTLTGDVHFENLPVNSTGDAATISGNLFLSDAPHSFDISSPHELEIPASISGPGGITLVDVGGTLIFDGDLPNTYTGTTYVTGGHLSLKKPVGIIALAGPLVIGLDAPPTGAAGQLNPEVTLTSDNQLSASSPVTLNGEGLLAPRARKKLAR